MLILFLGFSPQPGSFNVTSITAKGGNDVLAKERIWGTQARFRPAEADFVGIMRALHYSRVLSGPNHLV